MGLTVWAEYPDSIVITHVQGDSVAATPYPLYRNTPGINTSVGGHGTQGTLNSVMLEAISTVSMIMMIAMNI